MRKPHPIERKTGDQGQRFLVRAYGYPHENQECDIGFCNELKSATMMLHGIQLHPSVISSWIIDRVENQLVDWDGNPEEHVMNNEYECAVCHQTWTDQWSCGVDDDCPHCGARHMTPVESENDPDCTCLMCKTRKQYAQLSSGKPEAP